jgi:hypothetical protein
VVPFVFVPLNWGPISTDTNAPTIGRPVPASRTNPWNVASSGPSGSRDMFAQTVSLPAIVKTVSFT